MQDDLTELLPVFDIPMGFGGLFEGKDAVENGVEDFFLDKTPYIEHFTPGSHVGAENGPLFSEENLNIQIYIGSTGRTAGHESAVPAEASGNFGPDGLSNVFENDVHPFFAHVVKDLLSPSGRIVVVNHVRAEFSGFPALFFGPGRCEHAASEELCDLDGSATDPASGSNDENVFPGSNPGKGDEHVPCSEENEGESCCFFPVEVFGFGEQIAGGYDEIIGVTAVTSKAEHGIPGTAVIETANAGFALAATYGGIDRDGCAGLPVQNARADFIDDTDGVGSENDGERKFDTGEAFSGPDIEMIDSHGVDPDSHFTGSGFGIGEFSNFQDFRTTVFMDLDGTHDRHSIGSW